MKHESWSVFLLIFVNFPPNLHLPLFDLWILFKGRFFWPGFRGLRSNYADLNKKTE